MAFGIQLFNSAGTMIYDGSTYMPSVASRIFPATITYDTSILAGQNLCFVTPNNGFTSYISGVVPDTPVLRKEDNGYLKQYSYYDVSGNIWIDYPGTQFNTCLWSIRGVEQFTIPPNSYGLQINSDTGIGLFDQQNLSLCIIEDLTIAPSQIGVYSGYYDTAVVWTSDTGTGITVPARGASYMFQKEYIYPPLIFMHYSSPPFILMYFIKNASGRYIGFAAIVNNTGTPIRFRTVCPLTDVYGYTPSNTEYGLNIYKADGTICYDFRYAPASMRKGTEHIFGGYDANGYEIWTTNIRYNDPWALVSTIVSHNRWDEPDSNAKGEGWHNIESITYFTGVGWSVTGKHGNSAITTYKYATICSVGQSSGISTISLNAIDKMILFTGDHTILGSVWTMPL